MATPQLIFQAIKKLFFSILTIFIVYFIFINLYGSWFNLAPQTKLDRVQTDLIIQALSNDRFQSVIGESVTADLYSQALDDYLRVEDQSTVVNQVGLLKVKNNRVAEALNTWQKEANETSSVLLTLWQDPPDKPIEGVKILKSNLKGWYEYFALQRFYKLFNPEYISTLELQQKTESEEALLKLVLINLIPIIGSLIGIVILLFFLIRLRQPHTKEWQIEWDAMAIWQVLVGWFSCYIFIAQLLPRFLRQLPWDTNLPLVKASIVGITYISSMSPMLPILFLTLRSYPNWKQVFTPITKLTRSVSWGVGGYFAAIPLVVLSSIVQQLLLKGRGGGNPLLEIIGEGQNYWSIGVFWSTLAIGAPVFEELLFRGFLLPSLTKYFPIGVSILFSGLLFAIVHLNINDVLPLTVLGIVLGRVYYNTKNLLTPIIMHGLWNTGSLISLILLRQ